MPPPSRVPARRRHQEQLPRELGVADLRRQAQQVAKGARPRSRAVVRVERVEQLERRGHVPPRRVRVEHANNLDGKLDAAEAKQDAKEREEAAEARQARLAALEDRRAKDNATKAMLNTKVRNIHKSRDESKAKFREDKREQVRAAKEMIGQWNGSANAAPVSAFAFSKNGTEPGTAIAEQIDAMPIMARRPFLSSL